VDDVRRRVTRIADSRNLSFTAAVKQTMPVRWPSHCRVTFESNAMETRGHLNRKIGLEFCQFYWYRGFLRYSANRFRPLQVKVICLAVLVGSNLRSVIALCRQRGLNPIVVNSKVVRLAGGLVAVRQPA